MEPMSKLIYTKWFKLLTFALAVTATLAVAFGLGWHFGANDTDKKAYTAVWGAISAGSAGRFWLGQELRAISSLICTILTTLVVIV